MAQIIAEMCPVYENLHFLIAGDGPKRWLVCANWSYDLLNAVQAFRGDQREDRFTGQSNLIGQSSAFSSERCFKQGAYIFKYVINGSVLYGNCGGSILWVRSVLICVSLLQ